jgi:hypothetical protein
MGALERAMAAVLAAGLVGLPALALAQAAKPPEAAAIPTGQSVAIQTRMGWTRHSLKAGDHIVAQIHPLRPAVAAGALGGALINVTLDGKALGTAAAF